MSYIDRDMVIDDLMNDDQEAHTTQWILEKLISFPELDLTEKVTAPFEIEWGGIFIRHVKCGNCGSRFDERTEFPFNFCPYCSARRGSHDA